MPRSKKKAQTSRANGGSLEAELGKLRTELTTAQERIAELTAAAVDANPAKGTAVPPVSFGSNSTYEKNTDKPFKEVDECTNFIRQL